LGFDGNFNAVNMKVNRFHHSSFFWQEPQYWLVAKLPLTLVECGFDQRKQATIKPVQKNLNTVLQHLPCALD